MSPTQGEAHMGRVSLLVLKARRNIGKWFQSRISQVLTSAQAHGKGSYFTSDSSSGRRNTLSSIETRLPVDNQQPTSMSANERENDLTLKVNPYANLPPPPPPPKSAMLPLIQAATPVEQLGELSEGKKMQKFCDIEEQQDRLVATREDLMGSRFRMQMERRKICEIREKTGAREGSVMNQLRTFLHKQEISLPRDIEETFEQIDALRDQLGLLEADYDSSEQDYTLKEIEYNGKEMDFIKKLRSAYSRCPAASTFTPAETNVNTKDIAPATSTDGLEIVRQKNKLSDAPSSEKGLQIVMQTKPNLSTQEVEDPQTTDIVLFSNKAIVDDWLVDTLFQSPIQRVNLKDAEQNRELNQGPLSEQAPRDWYWVGTFGAQFEDEELKGSHEMSQEQDSLFPSHSTLSSGKSVMVLHTKGFRSS